MENPHLFYTQLIRSANVGLTPRPLSTVLFRGVPGESEWRRREFRAVAWCKNQDALTPEQLTAQEYPRECVPRFLPMAQAQRCRDRTLLGYMARCTELFPPGGVEAPNEGAEEEQAGE